jgi:hypothetical protein
MKKMVGVGLGTVALTLVVSLLGCGGGPSGLPPAGIMPAPATCGTVDPCGGDLTGTWKVLGGCLPSAGMATGSCTQVRLLTLSYAGTLTFNSDMTYTATDFTETRAELDATPVSCWGYLNKTCAEEDEALKAQVGEGGSDLSYASCTGSTTCACTVAETAATVVGGSGTYSLQGNLINFAAASAAGYGGYSYCVQDGLLHLTSAATTTYSDGTQATTIGEDIVAEPQ